MSREAHKEKLLQFLSTIAKPYRPLNTINEDEGLVVSGLIDSMSILEIIAYLEREYKIDFAERGVDPTELGTIANILNLITEAAS